MSALAEARSWPNGFSMMTRRHWPFLLERQVGGAERRDRRAEEAVGNGEVEQAVAGRAGGLVQFRQMLAKLAIRFRIVEIARHVAHPLGEPLPRGLVEIVEMKLAIVGDESLHGLGEVGAPLLGAHDGEIDADQAEICRKAAASLARL